MTESVAYYLYGFVLAAAIALALGRSLVIAYGPRIVPALWVAAAVLGLTFGWAITGYIAYVRASAMRF